MISPDCVAGTQFEVFLRGFQDRSFQSDLVAFVDRNAQIFTVACPDGSHPLIWTDVHREFKALFDGQLEAILADQDDGAFTREEFLEEMSRLANSSRALPDAAELPETGGACVADFDNFLRVLTASEDYELFLQVMFQAGAKQRANNATQLLADGTAALQQSSQSAAGAGQSIPSTAEIEVLVPEGYSPGYALRVEYLGSCYELTIPEGCWPGSTFRVVVQVATTGT